MLGDGSVSGADTVGSTVISAIANSIAKTNPVLAAVFYVQAESMKNRIKEDVVSTNEDIKVVRTDEGYQFR